MCFLPSPPSLLFSAGGSLRIAWTPLGGAEQASQTSRGTTRRVCCQPEGGSDLSAGKGFPRHQCLGWRQEEAGRRAERRRDLHFPWFRWRNHVTRGNGSVAFLACDFWFSLEIGGLHSFVQHQ